MAGVVFKQSFKSARDPKAPMLNCKHLDYIATRPGAVHNPDCDFGLFGHLQRYQKTGNLNNLEKAKNIIREASKRRTIYRAIISLDHDSALRHGYYDRAAWEKLLYENVKHLAREMHIKTEDFRYAASFHCTAGHPHIHILYWDDSTTPRTEVVPKAQFEFMANQIRAAFGRTVFHEEIQAAQGEQKTAHDAMKSALQTELQALCAECNPYTVLDVRRIPSNRLEDISVCLNRLVTNFPKGGRLSYAFMPPDYKQQLDDCTDAIFKLRTFADLRKQLDVLNVHISDCYGNDEKHRTIINDRANAALHKEMGNQILHFLKDHRMEWKQQLTVNQQQRLSDMQTVLQNNPEIAAQYEEVCAAMPAHRQPWNDMPEKFSTEFNKLIHLLKSETYISISLKEHSEHPQMQNVRNYLQEQLAQDAGYDHQQDLDCTLSLLRHLCHAFSQQVHQQQAQQHSTFQSLSQNAKKDLLQRLSQQSHWNLEE